MTAKIKLNAASGGGSISIQAPSSSSNNRVISLPDIADGTLLTSQSSLDSTKLSPAISAGITMADAYKLTSSFSGTQHITSNWARDTSRGGGNIGSAMSESSGVFTFPSTGVYLVHFAARGAINNSTNREVIAQIYFTSNNTTFNETANCAMNQYNSGQNTHASCNVQKILDITDVSNQKVKFRVQTDQSGFSTYGSADISFTFVQFIRLGDT